MLVVAWQGKRAAVAAQWADGAKTHNLEVVIRKPGSAQERCTLGSSDLAISVRVNGIKDEAVELCLVRSYLGLAG
jgi:hypothetical protein